MKIFAKTIRNFKASQNIQIKKQIPYIFTKPIFIKQELTLPTNTSATHAIKMPMIVGIYQKANK